MVDPILKKEDINELAAEFASMIFEDIQKYVAEHMEEFIEWQNTQNADSTERRENHEQQKS